MEKGYRHLDEPLASWLCPAGREETIPEECDPKLLRYCKAHRDGKGDVITVDVRLAIAIGSQGELDAALNLIRRSLDGICLHHVIADMDINQEVEDAAVPT